jgi:hypothetical protein
MRTNAALWMFFRLSRWALWIAFFAYVFYVFMNKASLVTALNQLPSYVELLIYGLSVAAVFAGFFELMTREWSGLQRPPLLRMPPSVETVL